MNRPRILLVLLAVISTLIVIAGIVYGQTRTTQSKQNKQSTDKPQSKQDEKSAKETTESGTISVVAVGDVMLGTSYPDGLLPPNDGANELAEVAPILRTGDITFGNLEGPLLDGGSTSKCTDPTRPCFSF